MNLFSLPEDILIKIINTDNENIFTVSNVNKELYLLLHEILKEKKRVYDRKNSFYDRCKQGNFYWNAFNSVITLEECDFLYEKYSKEFGPENFISRVKYTMGEAFQVQTETWYNYIQIHCV
jgi:hypothetical protein